MHRSGTGANFKLAAAHYASPFIVDQCVHCDFLLSHVDSYKGVVERDQLNNFQSSSTASIRVSLNNSFQQITR